MKKNNYIFYFSFSLSLFISYNAFAQDNAKIKASFIYNFTKYIDWPNQNNLQSFRIGVLGNAEFEVAMETLLGKKSFNNSKENIPYKAVLFNSVDDILPTQILYVNGDDGFDQEKIFNKIKGKGTLLVAENLDDFNKSMINFIEVDDNGQRKQRFSLNQSVTEGEGFKISSTLLALAILDETGWKDVYSKFKKLLKNETNFSDVIEVNKKDLLDVVTTYEKQKKSIALQLKQMSEQNSIIEHQKEEIIKGINDINEKQEKIKSQEEKLSTLAEGNAELEKNVEAKIQFLKKQGFAIVNQKKEMEFQLRILNEQESRIENQKDILKTQSSQIQIQKTVIYLFIGVIVLILALVFFIYWSYRQKKKANLLIMEQKQSLEEKHKLLAQKNKEILDSIHYAARIQRSILPTEKYIDKTLKRLMKK